MTDTDREKAQATRPKPRSVVTVLADILDNEAGLVNSDESLDEITRYIIRRLEEEGFEIVRKE